MLNPRDIQSVEINERNVVDINNLGYINDPVYFDLEDPKEYRKYIQCIKRMVRSSIEYKDLVHEIKNRYFDNSSGISYNPDIQVRTELHHLPFTLEDIIELVYLKNKDLLLSTDPIDMTVEILILHFDGLIGLYNLDETEHEMIHNNAIFVPLDSIYGRVRDFYNIFKKYMSEYQIEVYENCEKLSTELKKDNRILNREYFDVKPLNVNMNDLKNTECIDNILNNYNPH